MPRALGAHAVGGQRLSVQGALHRHRSWRPGCVHDWRSRWLGLVVWLDGGQLVTELLKVLVSRTQKGLLLICREPRKTKELLAPQQGAGPAPGPNRLQPDGIEEVLIIDISCRSRHHPP